MSKKVLVPIADGSEEIETACIVDILRRADATVTVASVGELQVTGSSGMKFIADKLLSECVNDTYDLIVLPGGMPGAEHLRDSKELVELLKRQQQDKRLYAAICASPVVVFQHHGLLGERKATAYPSFADSLTNTKAVNARVVVDGNCITSRAPGTAIEFSLTLVEMLYGGGQKAKEIAQSILVDW
ncbi:MAG: DJ-1 family protein [Candidatus Scalindua sp. AMX11]|nr:MAG: DJ-1 family protein [Candidatus Scalindua sp.]NOG85205.1 DJ-1 family protein [Planctomycetota bacterium]RZV66147.1 MAG: DJ-1 family protein [Candidatus Scalindua sp. SCAELEC01]TDE63544.1 MAG: DJ-1 family protein [Candidatus Scalindua sp. AMX11]GJQ60876.1 MAG: 4-methyl-5(B-hydroxyethyl)-thiazole monophosphate biosynthesis protein [Candidatus Scalindua sp.]